MSALFAENNLVCYHIVSASSRYIKMFGTPMEGFNLYHAEPVFGRFTIRNTTKLSRI
jgi:hypothetical protein